MENGYTSHQIAKKLNVSTQTIRNWTERYPIQVEVEEDSSKRIYNEEAFKSLTRINHLKENVDELIRKELIAATPSYKKLLEEKKQLLDEVRKWKRAQENLLMNNEILLGKKRDLETELKKKNLIITRLLQERDEFQKKMKELTDICEKMHKKAHVYEERWGQEQNKTLFKIFLERCTILFSRTFYFIKGQQSNQDL